MSERRSIGERLRAFMRRVPILITCEALDAFVVDYLDGTLPRRQRFVFALHLLICPACRAWLSRYRDTLVLGRAAWAESGEDLMEEIPEDLVRAILRARGG